MGIRSLGQNFDPVFVECGTHTANDTISSSAAIDLDGCAAAEIEVTVGTWGDTIAGGQLEFGVKHGDDTVPGNAVDVPDALLSITITGDSTVSGGQSEGVFGEVTGTSDDDKVINTDYLGNKRYLYVTKNSQENLSTGIPTAIVVRKGLLEKAPA